MPVTPSHLISFAAGVAVGAAGREALPRIKEKLAPLVGAAAAGFGDGLGDRVAEIKKAVAEAADTARKHASRVDPAHASPAGHAKSATGAATA